MEGIPGAELRRQELDTIKEEYPYIFRIIGGIVLVGIGVLIGYLVFADKAGFSANMLTEVLSIFITISVLDTLATIRADKQLKGQLIREMGARDNGIALRAAEELRAQHGWLFDGSLQGAQLGEANLQGANLHNANLQGAQLREANLQGANLPMTNLQGANLYNANLQGAILYNANLREAGLIGANLQGANLLKANLQGAGLGGANLQGADLGGVEFDEDTKLPDFTSAFPSKWTPDTDMTRFTDPNHPNFWRSDTPRSPVFWGKSVSDKE